MKSYIYKKLPDGRYLQVEDDSKKTALEHFGVEALIEGLQTGRMKVPEGFVKKLSDGRYLDISEGAIQGEFEKVYGALAGLNGSSGTSGMSGSSGTSGLSGSNGTSGISGTSGSSGLSGSSGTSGMSGSSGISGTSGISGSSGSSGQSGTSGVNGLSGSSGSSGQSGTSGINGAKGFDGTSGTSGISIIGATGATGPAGRDGKPGQSGGRGPMGLQGPKGDKGDPGSGVGEASIPRFIIASYSITRGNEAMVHDLFIKDELYVQAGTGSYDFGSASFIDNALLDVEGDIWLDGVLQVDGEMNFGNYSPPSSGGGGSSGSSGYSGTSGSSGSSGASGSSGSSGENGSSGSSGVSGTLEITYSGITQSSKGKFILYNSVNPYVAFSYDLENWTLYTTGPFISTNPKIATDGTQSIAIPSQTFLRPITATDYTGLNWRPIRNSIFLGTGTTEAAYIFTHYLSGSNTWAIFPQNPAFPGFYSTQSVDNWATFSVTNALTTFTYLLYYENLNKVIAWNTSQQNFNFSSDLVNWYKGTFSTLSASWAVVGTTGSNLFTWNQGSGATHPKFTKGVDTGTNISFTYSTQTSYPWYNTSAITIAYYNKGNDKAFLQVAGFLYSSSGSDLVNWATASATWTVNGISSTASPFTVSYNFLWSDKLNALIAYSTNGIFYKSSDGQNWTKIYSTIFPATSGNYTLTYAQNWT